MQQREWRCACGETLLLQVGAGGPLFFDGHNRAVSCPRCSQSLEDVPERAVHAGVALQLLERARAGHVLEAAEHDELAGALGLEPVVLEQLLEQVRDRRQTVVVVQPGEGFARLNGSPPA